jgi:hypothetical protein
MPGRVNSSSPRENTTSDKFLGLARAVGIASALVAGLALGLGTYPDIVASAGPANWVLPFVFAPALAFSLGALWHVALGWAAGADDAGQRTMALGLGVALTIIGLGTSAWFLASKIGGTAALAQHQRAYLEAVQGIESSVSRNAADEDELVTALGAGAEDIGAHARDEGKLGKYSGKPGEKVVFTALGNAASSFSNLRATLVSRANDRRERLAAARREIAEAQRAVAAKNTPAFEAATARAIAALGEAERIRLTNLVSGLGLGLDNGLTGSARANIEATIGKIVKIARDIEERKIAVRVPAYEQIDAKEAVTRYPSPLVWIAACLPELCPFLFLVTLLGLRREPEVAPEEGSERRPENLIELEPRVLPQRTSLVPAE